MWTSLRLNSQRGDLRFYAQQHCSNETDNLIKSTHFVGADAQPWNHSPIGRCSRMTPMSALALSGHSASHHIFAFRGNAGDSQPNWNCQTETARRTKRRAVVSSPHQFTAKQ